MTTFRFSRRHRTAATWQNQQNECASSEDSDQPGHPPSLIRVFAVRSVGSLGPKVSSCGQRRLWSDWADAKWLCAQRRQISLGIRPVWSESSLGAHSLCWFCHVAAQDIVAIKTFTLFAIEFVSITKSTNNKMTCAPSEDSDQPVSLQSDQSLRCSPEEGLGP